MGTIERVCPNCGTGNPYELAKCQRCGTNLNYLPASRRTTVPSRVQGASAAALVLAASAFIARTGFRLLVREILPRAARRLKQKPASTQIVDPSPEDEPGYVIRGWRAWSVRRGADRSTGSEHFEWRIGRRDDSGPGGTK